MTKENDCDIILLMTCAVVCLELGLHLCVAGWMGGAKVGYPIRFPSAKCGENHVGVVLYKEPLDQSTKYDAYCYRLSGNTESKPGLNWV